MLQQRSAILAVALIMLLVMYLKGRQAGTSPVLSALPVSHDQGTVVELCGNVAHPGVYLISDRYLTNGAIKLAEPGCIGPYMVQGYHSSPPINAGDKFFVSCNQLENKGIISISRMPAAQLLTLGLPLDLNRLSGAELEHVPGIGPTLAGRIVLFRQINGDFASLADLMQVEGIGEKKFKQLSHYFNIPIIQGK